MNDWTTCKCSVATVAACALLALLVSPASAQRDVVPTRIPEPTACSKCELTFVSTVTLVAPDTFAERPEAVRRDGLGRYWVLARSQPPLLFDSQGRFLRAVGRRGQGPGEFGAAYDLLVAGETLAVLDAGNRRGAVLSPALTVARYVSLPFDLLDPVVVSWPDAIASGGNVATAEGAGLPLHITSFAQRDARILKSLGPGSGKETGPEEGQLAWHRLARSSNKTFWSAPMYRYDLFRWRVDRPLITLERRPLWFNRPSPANYNSLKEPPPPHIAALQEDYAGLLWVYVRVAASIWREAFPPVPQGTREIPMRTIRLDKLFATTIEAIDPKLRRVVARKRFDRYFISALPDRGVAFYEVGPNGDGKVVVGTLGISGQ